MIPTIIFRRAAPLYESMLQRPVDFVMPPEAVFKRKINLLERRWKKQGPSILKELSKITKLQWPEKDIVCYVTAGIPASFSHPLTLKLYEDDDVMFDVVAHELIHRLLNTPQNRSILRRSKAIILKPYHKETNNMQQHIIVHAILTHILLRFFGPDRLKKAEQQSKSADYINAWKVVDSIGYRAIIHELEKGRKVTLPPT